MADLFELKITRQHWIKDDGLYDPLDLCSHGDVYIKLGNQILSAGQDDPWCTTAAGLHLMRTLYTDYTIGDFSGQLMPCCGHFIVPDDLENRVDVCGCPSGIDWNVFHTNGFVKLSLDDGDEIIVSFDHYKNQVLQFVSEVESFYGNPKDKIVSNDAFDQDGFNKFWYEWNDLKRRCSPLTGIS